MLQHIVLKDMREYMNKFIYRKLIIATAFVLTLAGAGTASASESDFFQRKGGGIVREIIDAKGERTGFLQNAKRHWGASAMKAKNEAWQFRGLIQQFKGWFRARLTWY